MNNEQNTNSTGSEKKSKKLERKEKRIAQKAEKKRLKLEKRANRKPMNPVVRGVLVAVCAVAASAVITVCIIGMRMVTYVVDYKNGDLKTNLEAYKSQQYRTSILYAFKDNGKKTEIRRLHGEENREWVDFKDIPKNLRNAFTSLEDKRFYDHKGVDWLRTIKVFITNSSQGGSTITQQLVKNLTGKNEVTYIRKFNEILKALNLEENYKKNEILEAYLNTVYLGSGCYGVKTAAETFFGKELDELTVAECALLAGLTKNPYKYSPYTHLDLAIDRQRYCLDCMLEEGVISEKTCKKAKDYKIKIVSKKNETSTTDENTDFQSYYIDFVIDEVIADLVELGYESSEAWRMVYCGGLKIETAVDLDVQEKVEAVYEKRKGFENGRRDSRGELPNSAITVMDYQGRVVAIVGGAGKKTGNRVKNRASTSFRQPGSSIKPLSVYAPAIDLGYISSGSTTFLDKCITLPNGENWPHNYNGSYGSGQNITVTTAINHSYNTVPARIIYETLGISNSYDYVTNHFHLSHLTANDKDLSPLAVGGTNGGVSTLEMAAAYACFGNGGRYYEPYSYYRVLDRDGKVILDNTKPEYEQVIQESTADLMLKLLTNVTTTPGATAYGDGVSGLQTFAKTGTTTENNDKWLCSGTPYYVSAIWFGYDYPSNLAGYTTQIRYILRNVYSSIHEGLSRSRTFATVKSELED